MRKSSLRAFVPALVLLAGCASTPVGRGDLLDFITDGRTRRVELGGEVELHEIARGRIAMRQVNGADDRLERRCERGRPARPAGRKSSGFFDEPGSYSRYASFARPYASACIMSCASVSETMRRAARPAR